ncbi:RHS repeat-associated core domain-containing protein [Pectobacterium aroidearum]
MEYRPLRYAGQYADEETGLHYNLFRYSDLTVGRFPTPRKSGVGNQRQTRRRRCLVRPDRQRSRQPAVRRRFSTAAGTVCRC